MGRINEDVNAYVSLGLKGSLFLTYPRIRLEQKETQANSGGGYIVIGNPAQARGTLTMGNGGGISDDESRFYNMLNVGGLAVAEAHTGIRFQNAGHNITGTFKLYAYKDS